MRVYELNSVCFTISPFPPIDISNFDYNADAFFGMFFPSVFIYFY